MFLIEISHPAGTYTADDHATIAAAIVKAMTSTDDAPEATMRRARRMTHVAFRELRDWHTGDGPVGASAAPPVLATITLPEDWCDESGAHMMGTVRAAVRRVDRAHGWTRDGGDLWVNVVGVPNGRIGLDGKLTDGDGVMAYLTADFQAQLATGEYTVPEGKLLDPICGMTVTVGPHAITLDHAGETVGFCSRGCRNAYATQHDLAVA
ncbi:hypothetical protein NN3_34850 [Nocardia neocaledoniensis NBRC 108232]|uniref:YHS domain-containing protein n=1 Tax=Nocardia neocaledoniensis TaxID=236511 RepID=A0A317NBT0_9NOCA|nr:hypothetical protein [Nocardia neocaledoniensis]PWV72207.1 hypothetical protein DFR69_109123 [Nocardia neocaledoniensis]GEM32478.1 hypothetical protein NN3_34850 [Nocardia neocaledoniensis NBRC 108232]